MKRGVAIPFRGLPGGMCSWCGGFITRDDGTVNRRRNWHRGEPGEPNCIGTYKMTWPGVFRSRVFKRDGGVCAHCPDGTPPCDTPENPTGWHADHILPLEDGGTWELANAQTLCEPHHHAKTAAENSARAAARRPETTATTQLALEGFAV